MQALTRIELCSTLQPKVLVVENDIDNLIYISYALTMFGYFSITTQDARKCLELTSEYRPDLIVLDIKMPYLSGIDLIKILKNNRLTHNIPVIAVTAMSRLQAEQPILEAGFTDYLFKPFLLEDFRRVVSSHLTDTSLC